VYVALSNEKPLDGAIASAHSANKAPHQVDWLQTAPLVFVPSQRSTSVSSVSQKWVVLP